MPCILAVPAGSGWIIEIGGGLGRLAFGFLRRLCEMDDEVGHTRWRPAIRCDVHGCLPSVLADRYGMQRGFVWRECVRLCLVRTQLCSDGLGRFVCGAIPAHAVPESVRRRYGLRNCNIRVLWAGACSCAVAGTRRWPGRRQSGGSGGMCTWSCVGLRFGALDALRRFMLYHYRCTFRTATQHAVRLSFWCRLQRACCTSAYSTRSLCRASTSARSRTAYCPLVQMTRRLASLSRARLGAKPGLASALPAEPSRASADGAPGVRRARDRRADGAHRELRARLAPV